jgi:hypothetical protein
MRQIRDYAAKISEDPSLIDLNSLNLEIFLDKGYISESNIIWGSPDPLTGESRIVRINGIKLNEDGIVILSNSKRNRRSLEASPRPETPPQSSIDDFINFVSTQTLET